jgi:hypothetical protein
MKKFPQGVHFRVTDESPTAARLGTRRGGRLSEHMLKGAQRWPLAELAHRLHSFTDIQRQAVEVVGFAPTLGQIKSARRDYPKLSAKYGHKSTPEPQLQTPETSPQPIITLDEAIDFFDRFSQIQQRRDPIQLVNTITLETDKPVAIRFFSCLHLGGRFTNHAEGIRLLREMLTVENGYVVSLGDDIESFVGNLGDVSAAQQQQSLDLQKFLFETLLDEMTASKRFLWGHAGQHGGDWLIRMFGFNALKEAVLKSGSVYFDGMGYTRLKVGSQTYYIASSHVFKGSSMYNALHALGRAVRENFPMADVAIQGDRHTAAYGTFSYFPFEALMGNRASGDVHLVQVGTAKTGPDRYTIKRFPPGKLGWPILVFNPHAHDIKLSWTLDDTVQSWMKNGHSINQEEKK